MKVYKVVRKDIQGAYLSTGAYMSIYAEPEYRVCYRLGWKSRPHMYLGPLTAFRTYEAAVNFIYMHDARFYKSTRLLEAEAEVSDIQPEYLARRWPDVRSFWINVADGSYLNPFYRNNLIEIPEETVFCDSITPTQEIKWEWSPTSEE